MSYLTQDKLAILGSAGAIGSNMVQTALTMGLTPNIAMYDPYEKGNQGAAEEIYHCSFPGARVTWTTNIQEALTDAAFVVTSGGAPRTEGMTREDLLKGNSEIAAQLGKDIKAYCPDTKFVIVIFNPADITGLVTLVNSGLPPTRVATLAALDSTRLQTALCQHFGIPQDDVQDCRTYGGHGEKMAVFASTTKIQGTPLTDLIGTDKLSQDDWEAIQAHVRQGGKKIIQMRGRSSWQSPSQHAMWTVKGVVEGKGYDWPCGVYVNDDAAGYKQVMMGMETTIDAEGVHWKMPSGTPEEIEALTASYKHLAALRDEVIEMGLLPPLDEWTKVNPNL